MNVLGCRELQVWILDFLFSKSPNICPSTQMEENNPANITAVTLGDMLAWVQAQE